MSPHVAEFHRLSMLSGCYGVANIFVFLFIISKVNFMYAQYDLKLAIELI